MATVILQNILKFTIKRSVTEATPYSFPSALRINLKGGLYYSSYSEEELQPLVKKLEGTKAYGVKYDAN